jgi:hypothetical protein
MTKCTYTRYIIFAQLCHGQFNKDLVTGCMNVTAVVRNHTNATRSRPLKIFEMIDRLRPVTHPGHR